MQRKGNPMFKVTIELPESVTVALGDTGKETKVDVKAIAQAHPDVIRFAVINGFMGALANVSRGKDDDGKANSDAVWATMRQKRADVWMSGEWAGKGGGGERASAALKEAFVAERVAAGATTAQIDKAIKAEVKEAFGDKEPATFARFLDALAIRLHKRDFGADAAKHPEQVSEYRERIEAKYRKLAEDAAKARAKAKDALDLSSLDF